MAERGVSSLLILFVALLCILIVISTFVSAYFGYLNIEGSVKGTASLETPFGITNWAAKTSLGSYGGIGFKIENKGFEPYYISDVEISNCSYNNNDGEGWYIQEHEKITMLIRCSQDNALKTGEMIEKDITITYLKIDGTLERKSNGFIKTQVLE